MVYWTIKAANECKSIDKVYISTDSNEKRKTVNSFSFSKAEVINRSAQSASDTASTEMVMLEFAQNHEFDNIVLIQATSPLLTGNDLERGLKLIMNGEADSVLSTVRQKRFYWQEKDGYAMPINYDYNARPRRQEFTGYLVENGAFYITGRKALLSSRCNMQLSVGIGCFAFGVSC